MHAFTAQYEAALATQDWAQISPLIHEDCVATFTEGTYKGKQAVEAAFKKTFSLIKDETYQLSDIHWALNTASIAVFVYHFHWSGIIDGKPASGSGRGSSTIINHNGQWQLIAEHLSPNAS